MGLKWAGIAWLLQSPRCLRDIRENNNHKDCALKTENDKFGLLISNLKQGQEDSIAASTEGRRLEAGSGLSCNRISGNPEF